MLYIAHVFTSGFQDILLICHSKISMWHNFLYNYSRILAGNYHNECSSCSQNSELHSLSPLFFCHAVYTSTLWQYNTQQLLTLSYAQHMLASQHSFRFLIAQRYSLLLQKTFWYVRSEVITSRGTAMSFTRCIRVMEA